MGSLNNYICIVVDSKQVTLSERGTFVPLIKHAISPLVTPRVGSLSPELDVVTFSTGSQVCGALRVGEDRETFHIPARMERV